MKCDDTVLDLASVLKTTMAIMCMPFLIAHDHKKGEVKQAMERNWTLERDFRS